VAITINNGIIRGNVTSTDGLGNNSGTIDMRDGTIYGNVSISRGTMHNGTIIGRVIIYGFGFNKDNIFTMNGGIIKDSDGNGVSVADQVADITFIMNGGTISGHRGVGVSNNGYKSIFIMNGGTITENSGGGVSNNGKVMTRDGQTYNSFTMNDGEIYGNTTSGGGGGVNTSSNFTMKGGKIYNNTANASGGGLNHTGGTFTFDGGWIFNNKASNGNDISIGQIGIFNNNVFDNNIGAIGSPPPDFTK